MVSLRRVVCAAAVTAVVALLAACTADAPVSVPRPTVHLGDLRVQLPETMSEQFSGEYLAIANGYFEAAGFSTVTLNEGPSSGIAELLAGTADVALSDALRVGTAIAAQQAPLSIIGATRQANPWTILSLAEGANIVTATDLVGTTIGVQPGSAAVLTALLTANGIEPAAVTIVESQNASALLVNGDIDGYVTTVTDDPLTLAGQGYAVASLPFADNGLPFVAQAFVATDAYIESHRAELTAFLYAEIRGWTDAVRDPSAGSALAMELYGVDRGNDAQLSLARARVQAEQLAVSDETAKNGLLTISADLQAASIRSLAAAGVEIAADDLFDLTLLAEVYAQHPELVDYAG